MWLWLLAPVHTDVGVLGSSEASELNAHSDRSKGPGIMGELHFRARPQVVLGSFRSCSTHGLLSTRPMPFDFSRLSLR